MDISTSEEMDKLVTKLNDETFPYDINREPIPLNISENMLIDILKDTVDNSWGRDVLSEQTILGWLDNFKGTVFPQEYERILAMILAVNIVYYSERDISYLSRIAYRKILHNIMEQQNVELESAVQSIMFYPLGNVSESGPFLAYSFRKANDLPVQVFAASVESIIRNQNVQNIVFLDDISISGDQITRYIDLLNDKNNLWQKAICGKNIFALVLIATEDACDRLKKKGIQLCSPIVMDDRSKCFSEKSVIYKMFGDNIREQLRLQTRYMSLVYGYKLLIRAYQANGELQRLNKRSKTYEQIKEKLMQDALGYGDAEVLIALEYNTPNNSLPIIWVENEDWNPLFKRYEKKYAARLIGGIEDGSIFI